MGKYTLYEREKWILLSVYRHPSKKFWACSSIENIHNNNQLICVDITDFNAEMWGTMMCLRIKDINSVDVLKQEMLKSLVKDGALKGYDVQIKKALDPR